MLDAATKTATAGAAGIGDAGGSADVNMNHGGNGVAAACWDFAANAACM